jgi:hypothetical protein
MAAFLAANRTHAPVQLSLVDPSGALVRVEIVREAAAHLILTNVARRVFLARADVVATLFAVAPGGGQLAYDRRIAALRVRGAGTRGHWPRIGATARHEQPNGCEGESNERSNGIVFHVDQSMHKTRR